MGPKGPKSPSGTDDGDGSGADRLSYEETRAWIAENYGYSFEIIDNMSFEQIDSLIRKGKRPKGLMAHSVEEAVELAEHLKKHWREVYGI